MGFYLVADKFVDGYGRVGYVGLQNGWQGIRLDLMAIKSMHGQQIVLLMFEFNGDLIAHYIYTYRSPQSEVPSFLIYPQSTD